MISFFLDQNFLFEEQRIISVLCKAIFHELLNIVEKIQWESDQIDMIDLLGELSLDESVRSSSTNESVP